MYGGAPYTIRPYRMSDMAWVLERHREIPSSEFGFSQEFPKMVEQILADFVKSFDEKRELCWIAEIAAKPVGCVFLVKRSREVAQLRLLLVQPEARGLGIGGRLIGECVRCARNIGYGKIVLTTDSIAIAARRLYEKAGFKLVRSEPHQFFGRETIAEEWELQLSPD